MGYNYVPIHQNIIWVNRAVGSDIFNEKSYKCYYYGHFGTLCYNHIYYSFDQFTYLNNGLWTIIIGV